MLKKLPQRTSDFKINEYEQFTGGREFEPAEGRKVIETMASNGLPAGARANLTPLPDVSGSQTK